MTISSFIVLVLKHNLKLCQFQEKKEYNDIKRVFWIAEKHLFLSWPKF